MKQIILILTAFFALSCNGQETKQSDFKLTVSPIIDKSEKSNQAIINALIDFLQTKNASLTDNIHWLQADFKKYIYPYLDIYNIENSKYGKDFFKPTLMEIIKTENENQKIIKIAFIGYNNEMKESQIKSIFNIIANIEKNEIIFSRYLDYATLNWQILKKNDLTYIISPNKPLNETEIFNQQKDIEKICDFFDCKSISITYYSCINPKEVFEIKGFDYIPMMYVSNTGGLADFGNIIYSGNNSEIYTHEIVHIYTNNLFPKINKFLDEGIATYFAGSGNFGYEWHRDKLDKFLSENKDFDFKQHTDPFERLYFEEETPIPYLAAALILERTKRIYGTKKIIELLKSESEVWQILNLVGLTKENINEELRKEIKLPTTGVWLNGE